MAQYTSKNIIKGYSKHFKVDLLCAARELQMLGLEFPEFWIQQLKGEAENRRKQNERRRQIKEHRSISMFRRIFLLYSRLYLRRWAIWHHLERNGAGTFR
jgi:hypothetical protein